MAYRLMTYTEQDIVNVLSPNLVQHALQHSTHDNKHGKICLLVSISFIHSFLYFPSIHLQAWP